MYVGKYVQRSRKVGMPVEGDDVCRKIACVCEITKHSAYTCRYVCMRASMLCGLPTLHGSPGSPSPSSALYLLKSLTDRHAFKL